MSRRVPPLNPLRVFDAVARFENLTAAAQSLHVSQSAVSRQIATLESYLGVELLKRERRGVVLTRVGAEYAKRIGPAFEEITAATEHLFENTTHAVLRVRTYTTFAAKWLIPRLPDFRARCPDIEVVLSNAVPDVNFDQDDVDVAIQFGEGRWPNVQADFLWADSIEPICSPDYLSKVIGRQHGSPEDLLVGRFLVSKYRKSDWPDWLKANGLSGLESHAETMSFSTSILTWQAALDGLGMAMGQTALLQPEFKKGLLVRPFNQPLKRSMAYYLLRPKFQRHTPRVSMFREWLLDTVTRQTDMMADDVPAVA